MARYITATEAAKRLNVTDKSVRLWIKAGKLDAHHVQKNRLAILESDIDRIKRERALYHAEEPDNASLVARVEDLERRYTDLERRYMDLERRVDAQQRVESSVSDLPIGSSGSVSRAQKSIVEANRGRSPNLPDGCILMHDFARMHGVKPRTFRDHIVVGIGKGLPVEQKDRVGVTERIKLGREETGEIERYLTPAQQEQALAFWKRHGVRYVSPDE